MTLKLAETKEEVSITIVVAGNINLYYYTTCTGNLYNKYYIYTCFGNRMYYTVRCIQWNLSIVDIIGKS